MGLGQRKQGMRNRRLAKIDPVKFHQKLIKEGFFFKFSV